MEKNTQTSKEKSHFPTIHNKKINQIFSTSRSILNNKSIIIYSPLNYIFSQQLEKKTKKSRKLRKIHLRNLRVNIQISN